jgi:hypothetical protein
VGEELPLYALSRAPLDETVMFVEGQVTGKGRLRVNGPSVADHIADSHE